jgi:hypothetical protein
MEKGNHYSSSADTLHAPAPWVSRCGRLARGGDGIEPSAEAPRRRIGHEAVEGSLVTCYPVFQEWGCVFGRVGVRAVLVG